MSGKGELTWTQEGVSYKGDFKENVIKGKGKYVWPDGSWYEGEVFHGLRNGYGIYETGNKGIRYEGEWKNGLRHGKGKQIFMSGGVYEGDFKKGYKSGQGKMTYPSGNYYEGEWHLEKK